MSWAERAENLATDARELGGQVAAIHAAAWRARVEPAATGGLAGAATALYAPRSALFGSGKPLPSDRAMIGGAEECEIEAAGMFRAAQDMRTTCDSRLSDLYEAHRREAARLQKAQSGEEPADQGQIRDRIYWLEQEIADCEVALEILAEVAGRLAYAVRCLQRVPDDLSETYEAAYWLLHRGHRLPRDGDFLTGTPATPDHPRTALSR